MCHAILLAIFKEEHHSQENHWQDSTWHHKFRLKGQPYHRGKHHLELQNNQKRLEERAFKNTNPQIRHGSNSAQLKGLQQRATTALTEVYSIQEYLSCGRLQHAT
jgi:hypothetical protein